MAVLARGKMRDALPHSAVPGISRDYTAQRHNNGDYLLVASVKLIRTGHGDAACWF